MFLTAKRGAVFTKADLVFLLRYAVIIADKTEHVNAPAETIKTISRRRTSIPASFQLVGCRQTPRGQSRFPTDIEEFFVQRKPEAERKVIVLQNSKNSMIQIKPHPPLTRFPCLAAARAHSGSDSPRTVIHYPRAASLPTGEGFWVNTPWVKIYAEIKIYADCRGHVRLSFLFRKNVKPKRKMPI